MPLLQSYNPLLAQSLASNPQSPFCPFSLFALLLLRRLLFPPNIPHRFVLGREFGGIIHECRDWITNPTFVRGLQASEHFVDLRRWHRERHFLILRLAEHAVASTGQN